MHTHPQYTHITSRARGRTQFSLGLRVSGWVFRGLGPFDSKFRVHATAASHQPNTKTIYLDYIYIYIYTNRNFIFKFFLIIPSIYIYLLLCIYIYIMYLSLSRSIDLCYSYI